MTRSRRVWGFCLSLLLSLGACGGQPAATNADDASESGTIRLTTNNVPPDVKCIVLTAVGPISTVNRAFDVTPSQPAQMTVTGLPTGAVTLTESTYNTPCAQVTPQTPLTWVSQSPVVVQLVPGQSTAVYIDLRRAGDVVITTTFTDDSDGGGSTNNPPTIAAPASATPNTLTGTTTVLSVLGADDQGESNLTYTWAAAGTPPAAVFFNTNGTNSAKSTTAFFSAAGTYAFQVTVKDQGGLTTVSATSVTVTAKLTSIFVSPSTAIVSVSGTRQFTAAARDQFAMAMPTQPIFSWAVSGGGTISANGLFTAGTTNGGPYQVTASNSGVSGKGSVTVLPAPTLTPVYQINSGSSTAVSPFSADAYVGGGTSHSVTNAINTTGVANAAPAAVYQSERYGNTTYTLPGLVASAQYTVRLHFAELYWTAAARRVFNVTINGAAVLSNFDIYATAGAQYKAVVRDFPAMANTSGQIVIALTTVTDNASISGVELLSIKYPDGTSCTQGSQCQSGKCTDGICVSACTTQSTRNLIQGAGFDTAATLSNWTNATGTSFSAEDVEGCASGSVTFNSGSMNYCVRGLSANTTYMGMKGKGSVGCIGMFFADNDCAGPGLGPDFMNLAPTDTTTWSPTNTLGVQAPAGTRSLQITCSGTGAIDQIYLNQVVATGFGGAPVCTAQSNRDLVQGAGFDTSSTLSLWTNATGTSWTNDDVEGCASGSVTFTNGSMEYCVSGVSAATTYAGMKGKGSVGCIGMFLDGLNCTGNGLGPDFLNLASTDTTTWSPTNTLGVQAPAGTRSIRLVCSGTGAMDQIYVNQGTSSGFGDPLVCSSQSANNLIPGAGFNLAAALAGWSTTTGATYSNDDAEGCVSGSVSFTGGTIRKCVQGVTNQNTFLGMKGKGSVGCLGMFFNDLNCTVPGSGFEFLNMAPTGSTTWESTSTLGVTPPAGTQSVLLECMGTGAMDQIFLNQGSKTGF